MQFTLQFCQSVRRLDIASGTLGSIKIMSAGRSTSGSCKILQRPDLQRADNIRYTQHIQEAVLLLACLVCRRYYYLQQCSHTVTIPVIVMIFSHPTSVILDLNCCLFLRLIIILMKALAETLNPTDDRAISPVFYLSYRYCITTCLQPTVQPPHAPATKLL